MTWAAHIEHTAGGLAITFAEPLQRLDITADVAAHLASLLAVEARHRLAGVVRTLEAAAPTPAVRHVLCCDCDPCLNGGHRG